MQQHFNINLMYVVIKVNNYLANLIYSDINKPSFIYNKYMLKVHMPQHFNVNLV